nr:disease resistance protein TAO1-like [Malus domestica]
MNLSGCEFLEKIPNLSRSPNIKYLGLSGCKNLVEVDDSVGFLDKLEVLFLTGCSKLTRFATRLGLRSLKALHLTGCTRLERFPEIEKDKMKSLTLLEIGKSGIRELPSSIAYLTGLTQLIAYGCELQNVPDLSGSPNIRTLDLSNCTSLVKVDDSVGFLDKLEILNLSGCSNLTRFGTRLGLRSLEDLNLNGCTWLERFPEIERDKMKSLWSLEIGKSSIRELPSSIAYLTGLTALYANGCELQNVPDLSGSPNIWQLDLRDFTSLVEVDDSVGFLDKLEILNLSLSGCRRLESFPEIEGKKARRLQLYLSLEGCNLSESDFLVPLHCWSALTGLNLSRNNFVSLPDCISKAVNLWKLTLSGCKRLREIPVLPPKLEELHLDDCTSLEKIPKLPQRLGDLNLRNCSGLSGDEVAKLENNLLNEEICPHLSIIYPGNEVPKWFSYTSNHPTTIQPLPEYKWDEDERKEGFIRGSEIRFEIPLKLQVGETLFGLALSFVVEPSTYHSDVKCIIINGEKTFEPCLWFYKDLKATHVKLALVGFGEQEQHGDICQVVFRFKNGSPIKSCGVHCLLRNQDELLPLSLRPTSSLGFAVY